MLVLVLSDIIIPLFILYIYYIKKFLKNQYWPFFIKLIANFFKIYRIQRKGRVVFVADIKYLDSAGLAKVWAKIKSLFTSINDDISNLQESVGDLEETVNNNSSNITDLQTAVANKNIIFQGDIKAMASIREGTLITGLANGYREIEKNKNFVMTYPPLIATTNLSLNNTSNIFPMSGIINLTKSNGGTSCNFTPYKVVYIKGTLDGITFKTDATNMFVQDLEDDYYYYLLGYAINTESIFVYPYHNIYRRTNSVMYPYGVSNN